MLRSLSNAQFQLLPPEILDNIFKYLSFRDKWRICSVSNSWRFIMLHWGNMFKQLSTDEYKKGDLSSILLPYKPYINDTTVKYIQINVQQSEDLMSTINFLVDNKCNQITKVNVTTTHWKKYNFLRMTTHCGKMLTELSLTFNCGDDGQYRPSPDLILRHCPKLRSLFYAGPIHCIRQWNPSFPTHFKHDHLQDLGLYVHNSNGTFEAKNILSVTPYIQRLRLGLQSIENTSPLLFLETLQQFCPKLVTLAIQHKYGSAIVIDPDLLGVEQKNYTNFGLENFVFHDPFDKYSNAQLLVQSLIGKYHQSLRAMYINCTYMRHDQDGFSGTDQLDSFILPSLRHLSLLGRINSFHRSSNSNVLHPLSCLITNSTTNLQQLDLTYLEGNIELGPFASQANQIQKIHLTHCNAIGSHQLASLFGNLASKKKLQLTHIILRCMQHVSSEVLFSIASIAQRHRLKEVIIDHCDNVTIEGMELFLNNIPTYSNGESKINKINASLIYQSSGSQVFPEKDKIQQVLHKLDARVLEWKLSLTSYTDFSVHLESYNCLQYRKEKKDSTKLESNTLFPTCN
ncbi:hypothetical protein BDC45DRAFT_502384 [Circinella umbellata]|nr:hypothetical protein BDC45DRAFT_502384 [Circinella umbellata]